MTKLIINQRNRAKSTKRSMGISQSIWEDVSTKESM